ncbi:rhodanese-related sulfurtransferase [Lewinella sp. IMCC34183]|uniref:oxygen-dependent tRNA uridine(34) hydroxylase TrhO n=1 Tax=Lewinella sp. IMCC34183 TaxID=2248762 RepID=UPI000E22FCBA|nr:rhodanese-related sulfurtransferase [Lewinella sp. IMCC34183]
MEPTPHELRNLLSREELQARLDAETVSRTTLSFYRYARIDDPAAFRDACYREWSELGVLGRIYVATEGINGQLSVPTPNLDAFRDALYAVPFLNGTRLNIAIEAEARSFLKLIIRVRPKIVADGLEDDTFDVTRRGRHLSAREVNELLDRDETIVVDMRNHYESEVGYFEGAIRPQVTNFRDILPVVENLLADKKDREIVMYCTGGIRCEKASAYYLHRGFDRVSMVDGGIIEYARQCERDGLEKKYIGKNFVFDERLGERITEDVVSRCHQCGTPSDRQLDCANTACHILFIQCPNCAAVHENCCSVACRDFNRLPADERAREAPHHSFNGQRYGKAMPPRRESEPQTGPDIS